MVSKVEPLTGERTKVPVTKKKKGGDKLRPYR
jgi:hypothetical protein